jgi:hypothetical protein
VVEAPLSAYYVVILYCSVLELLYHFIG